jgi:glycosyltransferase involved in cell wall biosynthesis
MAFRVLLAGQPAFMASHGFKVILVSADGKEREDVARAEACPYIIVPMTRKITPLQDIVSFFRLRKVLKKYQPDIVHTHTPKAGLLGMLAAKSLGIKIRIHTIAGLPLLVETGFKRKLLLFTEKLTYSCATEIWPNSGSMKQFILENRLTVARKVAVINNGSTNGVDLIRFNRQNLDRATLNKTDAGIPPHTDTRILCVGRMVKDKGIGELVNVFQKLQEKYPLQLLLVGPFEPDLDPLPEATIQAIRNNHAIVHIDWSDAVEYYMALADIFVHPSHREGFPNVILQAGAMQLPVVCSDIPGNTDIVRHGSTGLVFKVKNETDLFDKLGFAIENKVQAEQIAHSLFEEVNARYSREKMHEAILENYNRLLKNETE